MLYSEANHRKYEKCQKKEEVRNNLSKKCDKAIACLQKQASKEEYLPSKNKNNI